MKAFVIDTNVPVVANGKTEQADNQCILACIDALETAQNSLVVLDDAELIMREYMRHLSFSGQPGPGDAFFKWLFSNQRNAAHCEMVHISPCGDAEDDYQEFPADTELDAFDKSDRKFVAAANASCHRPEILNAVDTDWWKVRNALKRNGIRVKFLCPQAMSERG